MINPEIYNIKNSLGQGGMAEVFLAEDLRFHSNVAIKILNKELTHNSNISQRFIAEARNLFRLSPQHCSCCGFDRHSRFKSLCHGFH
ncbi:MAG: hypothetical protein ACKO7P_06325 [Bacteroidota bacterium]